MDCGRAQRDADKAERTTEVKMKETVDHPSHYGGENDPHEHIKVAEAKGWGYHIGNATKYLWRMGSKPNTSMIEDLKKAIWYLQRYLQLLEDGSRRTK